MRKLRLPVLIFSLLLGYLQGGDKVLFDPPEVWDSYFKDKITTLESVREGQDFRTEEDDKGVVILDEYFTLIDENGRIYAVNHEICRAYTDSGADVLAKQSFYFKKSRHNFYLITARTIQPDGTIIPFRENAVITHTPQYEAADSLYTDELEVAVHYPDCKAGSIVETITLTEIYEPVIPGEYTGIMYFTARWPVFLRQYSLEVPSALARHLAFHPVGPGLPEIEREEEEENGNLRFTAGKRKIPSADWEIGREPSSSAGPVYWISSLNDWNAFHDWYWPMLEASITLNKDNSNDILNQLEGISGFETTLSKLLEIASDSIRYTGLEFGVSGYKPYDCNLVWKNQYGDCKDKATLLAAMLKLVNIESYVTLLNTSHMGTVIRESPDYRHFNHAILTVVRPDGSYLFVDPTVEHLPLGSLPAGDLNRDVLLIKPDGTEFVRTPNEETGTIHVDFEVSLASDASATGWVSMNTTGYFGSFMRDVFDDKERWETVNAWHNSVEDLFPNLEIIDFEQEKPENWNSPFQGRAFFSAEGNLSEDMQSTSLPFPYYPGYLANTEYSASRVTRYFLWKEKYTFTARFDLQGIWSASQLPSRFSVSSDIFEVSANWSQENGILTSELQYEARKSVLSPEEYAVYHKSIKALKGWLEKPMVLIRKTTETVTPSREVELKGFTQMPTAQGQLRLIDRLFPSEKEPQKRVAALQKLIQWFPNDKNGVFQARIKIVQEEWESLEPDKVIERLSDTIKTYDNTVDSLYLSWAEYLLAGAYEDAGKTKKAISIYTGLIKDDTLTDFRRGWSTYKLVALIDDKKPRDAIRYLETASSFDFDGLDRIYERLLDLDLLNNKGKKMGKYLKDLGKSWQEREFDILKHCIQRHYEYPDYYTTQQSERYIKTLRKHINNNKDLQPLENSLSLIEDRLETFSTYSLIAQKLQNFDNKTKGRWTRFAKKEDLPEKVLIEKMDAYGRENDDATLEQHVSRLYWYLTQYYADQKRFPTFLHSLAWYVDKNSLDQDLEALILDQIDVLPQGVSRSELIFLRMKNITAADKILESATYAVRESGDKAHENYWRATYALYAGKLYESLNEWQKAADIYEFCEKETILESSYNASRALLRNVYVNFRLGNKDKIIEIIQKLSRLDENHIEKTGYPAVARELIYYSVKERELRSYWEKAENGYQQWLNLLLKLGLDPEALDQSPAFIDNYELVTDKINKACTANDTDSIFTELHPVVTSALLLPSAVTAVGQHVNRIANIQNPDRASELFDFIITMLKDYRCYDLNTQTYGRRLYGLYCLLAKRDQEAFDSLLLAINDSGITGFNQEEMVRLFGIVANRLDQREDLAIQLLQDQLQTDVRNNYRLRSVSILAEILREKKRHEEEISLLKDEISKAETVYTESEQVRLEELLTTLVEGGVKAEKLTTVIETWLERFGPDWYDYAKPRDENDSRMKDIQHARNHADEIFTNEEVFKFHMLLALNPDYDYEERIDAFTSAITRTLFLLMFEWDDDLVESLMWLADQKDLPDQTRLAFFSMAVNSRMEYCEDKAVIKKMLEHELYEKTNEVFRQNLENLINVSGMIRADTEELEKMFNEFTDQPLGMLADYLLLTLYEKVLFQGETDRADRMYKKLADAHVSQFANYSLTNLRLTFLQSKAYFEKHYPVLSSIRDFTLKEFQQYERDVRFDRGNYRNGYEMVTLPVEDAMAHALFNLRNANGGKHKFIGNIRQIAELNQQLPHNLNYILELVREVAGKTDDDQNIFYLLLLSNYIDLDDRTITDELFPLFEAVIDKNKHPMSWSSFRRLRAVSAWRTGEVDDPRSILEKYSPLSEEDKATDDYYTVLYYMSQDDRDWLESFCDGPLFERFINRNQYYLLYQITQLLGRDDMNMLCRELIEEEIYKSVLVSWNSCFTSSINDALNYAILIEDPSQIPEGCLDSWSRRIKNDDINLHTSMSLARLNKDWPELERTSLLFLEKKPTFYFAHWLLAEAIYNQDGDETEIRKHLEIFLNYCMSNPDYIKARMLLQKLENN